MNGDGTPSHDPALRASDADRDAVVDRLRSAHAEGRLTPEEFSDRMGAALTARTMGDLAALTGDLPAATAVPARTGDEAHPGGLARRDARSGPRLRVIWGSWLTASLVCVAIWGAVSLSAQELVYFWPMWVAGPWGAVLLARTVLDRD